jgi:hypothetical protein
VSGPSVPLTGSICKSGSRLGEDDTVSRQSKFLSKFEEAGDGQNVASMCLPARDECPVHGYTSCTANCASMLDCQTHDGLIGSTNGIGDREWKQGTLSAGLPGS